MGVVGQLLVVDGGKVKGVGGRVVVEWRWRLSGSGDVVERAVVVAVAVAVAVLVVVE